MLFTVSFITIGFFVTVYVLGILVNAIAEVLCDVLDVLTTGLYAFMSLSVVVTAAMFIVRFYH